MTAEIVIMTEWEQIVVNAGVANDDIVGLIGALIQ